MKQAMVVRLQELTVQMEHMGYAILITKSGNVFRMGVFPDFVWLTTRAGGLPGAYVPGAKRNEPDLTAIALVLHAPPRYTASFRQLCTVGAG